MSGASLPTDKCYYITSLLNVLIPDEWGKSSDKHAWQHGDVSLSLNPRWVGQVFRLDPAVFMRNLSVLIPDEWGKSSDTGIVYVRPMREVLIPDEWGKSSDEDVGCKLDDIKSLNPRWVGQVFRLHSVKKFHYFQYFI